MVEIQPLYGKQNPINAYEPCQVWEEAAISSAIYVEVCFP